MAVCSLSVNIEANKRGYVPKMQINILNWIMSMLPIILLIILLAVFRWPTTRAAAVTLVLTLDRKSVV